MNDDGEAHVTSQQSGPLLILFRHNYEIVFGIENSEKTVFTILEMSFSDRKLNCSLIKNIYVD